MFGRRRKDQLKYDPAIQTPVLMISICTGEKTLGFRNKQTGETEQVACIRKDEELKELCRKFGIREEAIKKEW
ncbi:hypothetical protein EV209_2481 [Cuneatibacter caecimuris]|uniref:Aspartate dehydrogenase n=2 Tax=Cuneatibacter caecimuris TaxID=1796618 RepID=A0A4Q7P2V3_9FIRM|nr:hypothetical protein EV209_2481 [Cuneatibacter caecimuris]